MSVINGSQTLAYSLYNCYEAVMTIKALHIYTAGIKSNTSTTRPPSHTKRWDLGKFARPKKCQIGYVFPVISFGGGSFRNANTTFSIQAVLPSCGKISRSWSTEAGGINCGEKNRTSVKQKGLCCPCYLSRRH